MREPLPHDLPAQCLTYSQPREQIQHQTAELLLFSELMFSKSKIVILPKAEAKTLVKRTLAIGNFLAELYVDTKSNPPLYHYIVTRKDSADIVAWGQEASAEIAEREALAQIDGLARAAKAG